MRHACRIFTLSVATALLLAPAVRARSPLPRPHGRDLERLAAAVRSSDYGLDQVRFLCDRIGPRLVGTVQAEAAARHVAGELASLGLEVKLEAIRVPRWVRGEESASLIGYPGRVEGCRQAVLVTALGGSVATLPGGIRAEVVVVDSFDQLAALPRRAVEGRIVLFDVPFDRTLAASGRAGEAYGRAAAYRTRGASAAAARGAVAALVRSVGGAEYRMVHTGVMIYEERIRRIPAAAVSAEDASLIHRLATAGKVTMSLTLTPRDLGEGPAVNVVADLKGSERPEEIVIVAGHLDSWDLGTGALDDAVGVAMAMETVRTITRLGLRPRRTIRVVPWMTEENSSAAARTYVELHREELARHVAAIESDLGAGRPQGFRIHAGGAFADLVAPVARVLGPLGAGELTASDHPVGSDVWRLGQRGVPTIALVQDGSTYFDYHHSAADTVDKVDPKLFGANCAAMAVMAYHLATVDGVLPRPAGR